MNDVAIIGLGPDYNYPEDHRLWQKDNTKYASNLGACLISRTLAEMFGASYVDISTTKPSTISSEYKFCVIAFATHATDFRDVTAYADFIDRLSIPVALFSLGMQDYSGGLGEIGDLHPSMKRLLDTVINSTGLIGVRGFYTASLLHKNGYRDVVPIGCPTLFRTMRRDFSVDWSYENKPEKTVNVFHRTLSELGTKPLQADVILGQDFQDEVVFCEGYQLNQERSNQLNKYKQSRYGDEFLSEIRKRGTFTRCFDQWFSSIGSADFVFGPRLHGCVAGITQGIPSLMLARDLRVEEIADFFKIPYMPYKRYDNQSIKDLYNLANYSAFNAGFAIRYDNFIVYLKRIGLIEFYKGETSNAEAFVFSHEDSTRLYHAAFQELDSLRKEINRLKAGTVRARTIKLFRNLVPRAIRKLVKLLFRRR